MVGTAEKGTLYLSVLVYSPDTLRVLRIDYELRTHAAALTSFIHTTRVDVPGSIIAAAAE